MRSPDALTVTAPQGTTRRSGSSASGMSTMSRSGVAERGPDHAVALPDREASAVGRYDDGARGIATMGEILAEQPVAGRPSAKGRCSADAVPVVECNLPGRSAHANPACIPESSATASRDIVKHESPIDHIRLFAEARQIHMS